MKLVIGLGNPGARYEDTRHNLGFAAIDAWLAGAGISSAGQDKFQGEFWDLRRPEGRAMLLKPMTFMNLSGQSVRDCAQFYKIPSEDWLVLHDELDLEPGVLRIKRGGGTAGHRGLESIVQETGETEFWRARLGIGKSKPVERYVLERIPETEGELFGQQRKRAISAVSFFLHGKMLAAMNQLNAPEN